MAYLSPLDDVVGFDNKEEILVYDSYEDAFFGNEKLYNDEDVRRFCTDGDRASELPDNVFVEIRRKFSKATPFYVIYPKTTTADSEKRASQADALAEYYLGEDDWD